VSAWRKYGKAIVAVVIAGLTVLASALTDDRVDAAEGIQIATAVTAALGVFLVPVVPSWPWAKTTVAVLLAALSTAGALIVGGLNGTEWVNVILAGLGVVMVGASPARSTGQVRVPPRPVDSLE
jgi:hypothetical protein